MIDRLHGTQQAPRRTNLSLLMRTTNRFACSNCNEEMVYEGPIGAIVTCPHCNASVVLDATCAVTEAEEAQPSPSRGPTKRRSSGLTLGKRGGAGHDESSSVSSLPPPPGSYSENRCRPQTGTRSSKSSGNWFLAGLFLLLAWPLAVAMFYLIFSPNKETDTYIWMSMLGLFSFFFMAMASSNARRESHDLLHWLILLSILPAALVGYYTAVANHGNKVGRTLPRFLQSSEYRYYQELVTIGFPGAEKQALDRYSSSLFGGDDSLVDYAEQLETCKPPEGSKVVSMHQRYVRAIRNLSASLKQARELQLYEAKYKEDASFVLRDLQLPQTPAKRAELQNQLSDIRKQLAMHPGKIKSAEEAAESAKEEFTKAGFDLGFWFGAMNK
jgi:hypothetical protein